MQCFENIKRAQETAEAAEAMEKLEAKQNDLYSDIVEDLPKTESEQSENADNEENDDKIVISENNGTVAFNKTGYRKNEKATMQ